MKPESAENVSQSAQEQPAVSLGSTWKSGEGNVYEVVAHKPPTPDYPHSMYGVVRISNGTGAGRECLWDHGSVYWWIAGAFVVLERADLLQRIG